MTKDSCNLVWLRTFDFYSFVVRWDDWGLFLSEHRGLRLILSLLISIVCNPCELLLELVELVLHIEFLHGWLLHIRKRLSLIVLDYSSLGDESFPALEMLHSELLLDRLKLIFTCADTKRSMIVTMLDLLFFLVPQWHPFVRFFHKWLLCVQLTIRSSTSIREEPPQRPNCYQPTNSCI